MFVGSVLYIALFLPGAAHSATVEELQSVVPKIEAQSQEADHGDHQKSATLSFDYKSDVVSGLRGASNAKPVMLGAVTIGFGADLERLLGTQKGFSSFLETSAIYGHTPTDKVGDFQGTDNIAAPHGIELSQAWLQQTLFDNRVSLLAGLHDLGSEFYITEASSGFLNNSFGVGPELARSGKAGASLWPTTALAGRIRYQPNDTFQASLAIYNGVPGDPDHPGRTAVILRDDNGVMGISEVALTPKINGLAGKYGVGGWTYSRSLDVLYEVDANGIPLRGKSLGVYFMADQRLYSPHAEDAIGLSGFFRFGWAIADTDAIEYASQTGLTYTGLLKSREQDQLGFGLALARAGSHYRAAVATKGTDIDLYEGAFELTYRIRANSWLLVQPDFQWVVNPNMNTVVLDAFVASGRLELSL